MKFICSIIVVEDVYRSRELYENILGQKVTADFGEYNVAFEGGLALYKKGLYQELIGSERAILRDANNFELYFEGDNLSAMQAAVLQNGFELIHPIREEPWKQQVFRFYDDDHNNVCIAERMEAVSYRLYRENKTVEEIAILTGLPVAEVTRHLAGGCMSVLGQ